MREYSEALWFQLQMNLVKTAENSNQFISETGSLGVYFDISSL